jgi:hypothetical protein
MAYIHVKDSLANILSEGTGLAPLTVGPLNASTNEESAAIQLTVYTDAGFKTYGNTTISFVGASASKWSVCATAGGTYAPTLTIATEILAAGTAFYVKAKATSDENPSNDVAVDISVAAVIAAV